ncbi:MAG: HD domain-containing protein [Deltaproteobacteria bacterium]|nr:HD domain-containing protein [Candidatus Anaeroferrophillacea bacterium]
MKQFLVDLDEGQPVSTLVLVARKSEGRSRRDKPFISLQVQDRSARLPAFVWEQAEMYARRFEEGDIIAVRGRTTRYQGALQLTIDHLEKHDGEIDPHDFLPTTAAGIEGLRRELLAVLKDVTNVWLRRLLEQVFVADREFADRFCRAPAAKGVHHACLGGLLEHTVGVARLARRVAPLYPVVDADLLLAGALLHDIGKVDELSCERNFDYTDRGRLAGHIFIGAEMVNRRIAVIRGFPAGLAMQLEHLILSHHGELNFGSPKRPKTLEAVVLHQLDDLDAKVSSLTEFFAQQQTVSAAPWSAYNRLHDRYFLVRPETLDEAAAGPEPAADDRGAEPGEPQEPTLF